MDSDPNRKIENEETHGASRLDTQEPAKRDSPGSQLSEGQLFGSYRLIRRLGKGGFGEVWEADNIENNRKLAIKILTVIPFLSTNIVERFQQEGRLAASINHPNCVYVFGAENVTGVPVITMELMTGGTLQDILNSGSKLAVKQAVDYTLSLMDGLEAAWSAALNPGWLLLIVTMRRRNGYAGLHEIISKTRVMALPQAEKVSVPDLQPAVLKEEKTDQDFRPYRVTGLICRTEKEAIFSGRDETLKRDVWIRGYFASTRPAGTEELSVYRSGRLRWIQGYRKDNRNWDVFESPSGAAFTSWVQSRGTLFWPEMRKILQGISTELQSLLAKDLNREISLQHIWIDASGQAKLLDFPLGPQQDCATIERWQVFLHQVLLFGLTGKKVTLEGLDGITPDIPVPESGRTVIRKLCVEKSFAAPDALARELVLLAGKRAEVTKWRRFFSLCLPLTPLFLIVFAVSVILYVLPSWFVDLAGTTEHLKQLQELSESKDKDAQTRLKALEQVLAYSYKEYSKLPARNPANLQLSLEPPQLEKLKALGKKYPSLEKTGYLEARKQAGLDQNLLVTMLHNDKPDNRPWYISLFSILTFLSFFFFASIFFVLAFRYPILLRLVGISVQTKKGERVGRLHCALRSLIAWLPILFFNPWVMRVVVIRPPVGYLFYLGLIALTLFGIVYAILNPSRGIQDRIAGTVLVPD